MEKIEILLFETEQGQSPYLKWEASLDVAVRGQIRERLRRIRAGNFGDHKAISGCRGLFELRFQISLRIKHGKS